MPADATRTARLDKSVATCLPLAHDRAGIRQCSVWHVTRHIRAPWTLERFFGGEHYRIQ